MAFKDNLLQKIKIDSLTRQVRQTLGVTPEGPMKLDREAMRHLLRLGGYDHRRVRELDFYLLAGGTEFLLLDNELKVYRTDIADAAMRKNPTVKEMVNIRNAIKILNDKDVVVSRKEESLQRIHGELLAGLDLTYNATDIAALAADGRAALANAYTDGVIETATLFNEILGYRKAPGAFRAAHHHVWGAVSAPRPTETVIAPLLCYDLMHNRLKLLRGPLSSLDHAAMQNYARLLKGEAPADLEGEEVWTFLEKEVQTRRPRIPL